ncbi:MAG: UDP-glucose 4-epimerase GalE [Clostridia bacterium]|nr:UDP-glucose 4-epimerase GalE [Clostridia bacterium]
MSILVTGGTGFIGSHTVVEFLERGEDIVIVDNFCNSKPVVLDRIERITGRRPKFYEVDLCDAEGLERVFAENPELESCIHFAGLKAVGESTQKPLLYYRNNFLSTLTLCETMARHGVKRIVFSSSATVYGDPERVPIRETDRLGQTTNPYGETKQVIERILSDVVKADPAWSVSLLRYFNPVGAHKSGLIGEDPKGIPNNLFPYVTQVAEGRRPFLHVYGNDYNTHDGTGVRDYIHVVDLARAHLKALDRARTVTGVEVFNIGTGVGYSVLDVVKAFETATGKKIPYVIDPRRPGDIDACYADPAKALSILGWQAEYDLTDMCRDANRWQSMNPNGYDGADA